jgi:hypothetical protein
MRKFANIHCVQTDPAKNVWTHAYLIPERNRTGRTVGKRGFLDVTVHSSPRFLCRLTAFMELL